MKRKKKQRSKTSKASLAGAAKKHFDDKTPSQQKLLMELLVLAERAGVVRWILQGASDAFRGLKAEATDYRSQAAHVLRERRLVVAHYLYSLLSSLDADTKAEILDVLVADLWQSSRSPMATNEPGNEQTRGYDERAAHGILRAMRLVARAYCELAKEGCETLAGELPLYATQLVEALNEIVRTRPELLKGLAAERIAWPIMAARHYPKESDFEQLAERIKLGSKTVVNLSPRARYKLKTPINRFLLTLLEGSIATPKDFYFVQLPDNLPKLTPKTVPYYLDDFIMPALDEIREKEGSWDGIPAVAAIVKGISYESEHRSAVRNRIKRALKAMAAPER
jgi:hypothetical protein